MVDELTERTKCIGCGGELRPIPARSGLLEHWRCNGCGEVYAWEPFGPGRSHRSTALNPLGGCWTVCEDPQAHLAEYATAQARGIPREDLPRPFGVPNGTPQDDLQHSCKSEDEPLYRRLAR